VSGEQFSDYPPLACLASGVGGHAGTGRSLDANVQPFQDEEVRRVDLCDATKFFLPPKYFRSKVF